MRAVAILRFNKEIKERRPVYSDRTPFYQILLLSLIEELGGPAAVSYTHLDVYKRQGLMGDAGYLAGGLGGSKHVMVTCLKCGYRYRI